MTPGERARFEENYVRIESGCDKWVALLDRDGYGVFHLKGRGRRAHRVAYVLRRGPIPEGRVVSHTCGNHWCVNHRHLRAISRRDATVNATSKSLPALNARKTRCKRGHPFDRTYVVNGRPQRSCSVCENAKHRRLRRNRVDPLKGVL